MIRLDFRKINLAEDQRRKPHCRGKDPVGVADTGKQRELKLSKSEWQCGWTTVDILTKSCIESTKVKFDVLIVWVTFTFPLLFEVMHFGGLRGNFRARTFLLCYQYVISVQKHKYRPPGELSYPCLTPQGIGRN